jgi:hypothetical protein
VVVFNLFQDQPSLGDHFFYFSLTVLSFVLRPLTTWQKGLCFNQNTQVVIGRATSFAARRQAHGSHTIDSHLNCNLPENLKLPTVSRFIVLVVVAAAGFGEIRRQQREDCDAANRIFSRT